MSYSVSYSIERLPTGVANLDFILNGGLAVGGAYIIQGPPGAGKTILANQIAFHQAAQGKRIIYITLLSETHDRMLMHLSSLAYFSEAVVADRLTYVSGFPELAANGPAGVMKLVRDEREKRGADVIVLDGLFVIDEELNSHREFRLFVNQLQAYAHVSGCTMLLLTNAERNPSSPEYTMVDGWIELTDEEHEARSLRSLAVRKFRGGAFVRGRHMYRISDLGIELFPRLEAVIAEKPIDLPAPDGPVSTGVQALDHMLRGGIKRGSALLVAGPSGTGKTLLSLQFIAQSTAAEPGLFFGFFEGRSQLRTSAASIGIDLTALEQSGAVSMERRAPTEILIDEIAHDLLRLVRERRIKRLVIDGLAGFEQNLVYPNRWARFLTALGSALHELGVTVLYTRASPPAEDVSIAVHVPDVSPLVENVVTLRRVERNETVQRLVSVVKVRDSDPDMRLTPYTITEKGLVLAS